MDLKISKADYDLVIDALAYYRVFWTQKYQGTYDRGADFTRNLTEELTAILTHINNLQKTLNDQAYKSGKKELAQASTHLSQVGKKYDNLKVEVIELTKEKNTLIKRTNITENRIAGIEVGIEQLRDLLIHQEKNFNTDLGMQATQISELGEGLKDVKEVSDNLNMVAEGVGVLNGDLVGRLTDVEEKLVLIQNGGEKEEVKTTRRTTKKGGN